jgi:hypothetical protein
VLIHRLHSSRDETVKSKNDDRLIDCFIPIIVVLNIDLFSIDFCCIEDNEVCGALRPIIGRKEKRSTYGQEKEVTYGPVHLVDILWKLDGAHGSRHRQGTPPTKSSSTVGARP